MQTSLCLYIHCKARSSFASTKQHVDAPPGIQINFFEFLQSIGLHDAAGMLASNVRTFFDGASEQGLE
jgi:hypothetical protein